MKGYNAKLWSIRVQLAVNQIGSSIALTATANISTLAVWHSVGPAIGHF